MALALNQSLSEEGESVLCCFVPPLFRGSSHVTLSHLEFQGGRDGHHVSFCCSVTAKLLGGLQKYHLVLRHQDAPVHVALIIEAVAKVRG